MLPPRYSLSKLSKLTDKIKKQLVSSGFGYEILTGEIRDRLVSEYMLYKFFPSKITVEHAVKKDVISSLLVDYIGQTLSDTILDDISRRIAGWSHNINSGKIFRKWDMQKPVWACLKVEDIEPILRKPKRYLVTLKSYSGSSVNMRFKQVFAPQFLRFLIKKIGGNRTDEYVPFDIYGLWLSALLEYVNNKSRLSHIFTSSSQRQYNKKLLNARKGECIGPFGVDKCFDCPIGIDQCSLGRHLNTYVYGLCRGFVIRDGKTIKHKGYIRKAGYCMHCLEIGNFTTTYKEKVNAKI